MAKNYEIWMGDDQGNRLASLNQASSFSYQKVLNDVGAFEIAVPFRTFNRSLIRRDARIEFWRRSINGPLKLDFVGLLRGYEPSTDNSGKTTIVLRGSDLNHLLKRRFVEYDSGTSYATADNEDAGDLMRRIVRENLGSSTTDSDRDWSDYITVESDLTDSTNVNLTYDWKNVLRTLHDIVEIGQKNDVPLWFYINPISPDDWVFQVRINQFGLDRTDDGNQVTVGLEFGNLGQSSRSVDWQDEKTHITAIGGGAGSARATQTATDSTRLNASIFNRIEGVKMQNVTWLYELSDLAESELETNRPVDRSIGQLIQTRGFIYGTHWNFGDKLGWTYLGQQNNGVVRMVTVKVDANGRETIDARLETE